MVIFITWIFHNPLHIRIIEIHVGLLARTTVQITSIDTLTRRELPKLHNIAGECASFI